MDPEIRQSLEKLAASARSAGLSKSAAYLIDRILESATKPSGFLWPVLVGGGMGAIMGPEGDRGTGALAGILGASIGQHLLKPLGRKYVSIATKSSPENIRIIEGGGKAMNELLKKMPMPELERVRGALQTASIGTREAGRFGGGALGGHLVAQKVESDRAQGISDTAPVMYDLGGKYTGFLPDELNDMSLLGL